MIRLASNLQLNPHGIFYFRSAVPRGLRQLLGRSEIRCSLHTRERTVAIGRSRPISLSIQSLYRDASQPGMTFKEARELLQRFLDQQSWIIDQFLETHGPLAYADRTRLEHELVGVSLRAQLDLPNPMGVKIAEMVLEQAGIRLDTTSTEYRRFCVEASKVAVAQMTALVQRSAALSKQGYTVGAPDPMTNPALSHANPGQSHEKAVLTPSSSRASAVPAPSQVPSSSSAPAVTFPAPRRRRARRRLTATASPAIASLPAGAVVFPSIPAVGQIWQQAAAAPVAAPVALEDANKISQVLTVYAAEKRREGSWTVKTELAARGKFDLMVRIIGDVPMRQVGPAQARDYKQVLQKLPANLNVKPLYRTKTIAQILAMKPEEGMSIRTINTHLQYASAFFEWAERNGYADKNPFRRMALKDSRRPDEARAVFTPAELLRIFSTRQYREHRFLHPHYYWLPLLGLHTGARLNELCQLYLKDVRKEGEIWVLDINESEPDKRVKTRSARRLIPIHPKLIELGFLRFVESLKQRGEARVFPELKPMRDGAGQAASKWFARYRKDLGLLNQKPKKDFHSFRTTLINELKQKGHAEGVVAALVGHATHGLTFGTYGKAYRPPLLAKIICEVDFSGALANVDAYKQSTLASESRKKNGR